MDMVEGHTTKQQATGDRQSRDVSDSPSSLVYSPGSSMDSHQSPNDSEASKASSDSTIRSAFATSPTTLDRQPETPIINNNEDDEMEPGPIQCTESDEEESESEREQRKSTRLHENVAKNSNMQ